MMRKILTLTLMFCLLAMGLATLAFADGAGGAAAAASVAPGKIVAREAPKVVGLLRTTDKPQVQRYVPMAVELKYANPFEVAFFLRDAVNTESGLWGTFANTNKAGDVEGGIVIVCVPEYQLDKIRETIQMLDRPGFTNSSGTAWAYIQLKNRSVLDADVPNSLLQWVGNDASIAGDVETNAVLVIGSAANVAGVIKAAATYDVPTAMVSVAAKIYETDVTDDGALGLDFQSWKNGPGQKLFSAYYANYRVNPPNQLPTHIRQRGDSFNGDYPSEFFDFLAVKGRAQVLVKSEVSVLSGVSATFTSADDLLYYPVTTNAIGQRVVGPAEEGTPPFNETVTSTVARAGDAAKFISAAANVARTNERIAAGASNPAMTAQAGVTLAVTPIVADEHPDDVQRPAGLRRQRRAPDFRARPRQQDGRGQWPGSRSGQDDPLEHHPDLAQGSDSGFDPGHRLPLRRRDFGHSDHPGHRVHDADDRREGRPGSPGKSRHRAGQRQLPRDRASGRILLPDVRH